MNAVFSIILLAVALGAIVLLLTLSLIHISEPTRH